ncbi:hypothetical protein CR513_28926, partial [Mucuna pruriens]
MLDLGDSINVMPTPIYKSLNFGDLESTGMTIQLANRNVVQPLGILEDVLVQVNELIFPADFYVLDMEDETSGKGSPLILRRPFLMTAKTKTDVHVGTLSMEFAVKHPTEGHSLFGINLIDELVKEHSQLDTGNDNISNFVGDTDIFDCLGSEVHNLSNSEDDIVDLADLSQEVELLDLLDQVRKCEDLECSNNADIQVVETKKQLSALVATMFTTKYEPTNRGHVREKAEADSVRETNAESGLENAKSDSNQTRARSNHDNMSRPQQ